jgi:GTPase SAR1 family protein
MTEGLLRLKAILESFPENSDHWNEAQNRFQFIDRLLLECLGWEHPYISVEVTDELGGRADYLLGTPVRAGLEAKKEAVRFDFLPGTRPNAVRKLRPLMAGCKVFDAAVKQVLPYCVMAGAQVAIVCNGPQLAIFQVQIPDTNPLDGEAFVFSGFSDLVGHFALLWKLLSPEGIIENRALRDLAQYRNPKIPAKALTAIGDPSAFRYRSDFQENLRALGSILLDDIGENPAIKREFYKECYVPLEANSRHLLLSKNIIAARYRRVSENGIAPARATAKVVAGKIQLDESLQAGQQGARPIVVIGDVGVGKTSFFENLYESLTDRQKEKTYYLHINLGEKATLALDVKTHVLSAVPGLLREKYGVSITDKTFVETIYSKALEEFDNGVEGELKGVNDSAYRSARIEFLQKKLSREDEHLRMSLAYLSEVKQRQILLVLDNADQRKYETQQEAFLIAQELAATRSVLVFVALRPSTFYQSKLTGALSGYQNRVLTISPPPADEVIRKRIAFAVRVAEGKAAPAALMDVQLDLANVVVFLRAVLRSIRSSHPIQMFLGNITGGNIRLVIELMSSFCGSPNVEAERIVTIEKQTGAYQVPLHEFTKHALLGEFSYFNALSSSVACNVFDISSADPKEHFLGVLVTAYLSSPMGIKDNDGFVAGEDVVREMLRLQFTEEQARVTLKKLASRRLIETPHGHYREVAVEDSEAPDRFHFRATSIGLYHIRHWIGHFSFLDAMSIDTPIFSLAARGTVFENAASHDIRDRLSRAVAFRRYLEEKWQEANFQMSYYDFNAVMAQQKFTFDSVERAISRPQAIRRPFKK